MKSLHKNFSRYEEFINIYEEINIILEFKNKNSNIINEKNIDVKKSIEEYTDNIFSKFTEIQKNILNEILTWGKDNNTSIKSILQSSDEEKRAVFEYVYWLCKIDSKKMKFIKILPLKNLLGFKRSGVYYSDISINQVCPICNAKELLFIREYGNLKKNYFKCSKCNHIINNNEICRCSFCKESDNKLYITLKENLIPLLEKVDSAIRELNEEEEEVNIDCYEDRMLEDYKLYRLNIDRDLRELLSFKPKDNQDLARIIKRIDKRNSIYSNNNYKNSITKKLVDNHMIYSMVKSKYILRSVYRQSKDSDGRHYCYFIDTTNDIDEIKEFFIYENIESFYEHNDLRLLDDNRISIQSRYTYNNQRKFKNIMVDFLLSDEYFVDKAIVNEEVIMNKYFFEYDKFIPSNDEKYIKSVFQSIAEKDMYIDLRNKYPNNIIMINYKIKDVIDLNQLKKDLSKSEFEYLSSDAEFNFTMYDFEGKIKKIVQVQRGIHHNEEKWMWRDFVKKKVSKLCRIEYEEVF